MRNHPVMYDPPTTYHDRDTGVCLVLTCAACPEQYDAFLGSTQIGYLRLRHGIFRVDYPGNYGETVYTAWPNGDGCFDEAEREHYLRAACGALWLRHKQGVVEDKECPGC